MSAEMYAYILVGVIVIIINVTMILVVMAASKRNQADHYMQEENEHKGRHTPE